MKLLCFSDLHRNKIAAAELVRMSDEADILIGAGDFANRRQGVEDTIDILAQVDKPTILVPGNGESFEELEQSAASWPAAIVLHGSGTTVRVESQEIRFFGVGGGIPVTPFGDWSYDFDEEQAMELLQSLSEADVLVSHSPPLDTVDNDSNGQVRGSHTIRSVAEKVQPKLLVCGHIHSDWTKSTRLGKTLVLNAGPAGILVSLDRESARIAQNTDETTG